MNTQNNYPGFFSYAEAKYIVSICSAWTFATISSDRLVLTAYVRGEAVDEAGNPPAMPVFIASEEAYNRVRQAAAVKMGAISDDSLYEFMRLCRGYSKRPATMTGWDERDLEPKPTLRDLDAATMYLNSLPLPLCFMERVFQIGSDDIRILIESLGGLDCILNRLSKTDQYALCRRLTFYDTFGWKGPYGWNYDFSRNPHDQLVELSRVLEANQQAVEVALNRQELTAEAANFFALLLKFRPAWSELFDAADAALVTYGSKSEQVKPG